MRKQSSLSFLPRPSARLASRLFLASLLIWLSGCSAVQTAPDPAPGTTVPAATQRAVADIVVEKSPNDDREYRYLVLDNSLRVLLVSDPATDKSAASLAVLRGYYHEPEAYPGLAHFLEHMLFIGTEKYPDVDGYQEFVSAHGGQSNAYTSAEHTNYFFEIQPQYFRPAMDRFAQFFISPLLDTAYVDREKNAVHSEYQLQIKDDGWRSNAVLKTVLDPDYEGSRFYIGSLETLGEGVDAALREFFDTQYSADQMVLVALGAESLDQLESWVTPMFSAIENRRIGPAPEPNKAISAAELPARLSYQSLNDRYQISYNFPIPAVDEFYRSKPAQYLTNLLGHEGEGSLHQLMTARGWIESLGVGVNRLDVSNAFLSINIELTPAGRLATDQISQLLFGYIELLGEQEPEAWRYEEQANAARLSFRFQEQSSPTGFVYRTSPNLALYPPEDVLVADYLMEGFNADLIKHYLSYLTPENLLIERSGPDLPTDQIEPWFEVPYRLETGLEESVQPTVATLHMPEPNPFLPEQLDLLGTETRPPGLAVDQPGSRIWLAPDVEFRVPRANQSFTLGIKGGLTTPRELALAQIYERLVNDALNHYAYPAMLAGLGYQIGVNTSGFRLSVSGYSDKQQILIDRVLEELTSLSIKPDQFERYREELVREWRNFRNERPYTQTLAALSTVVTTGSFDPAVLAEVAQGLTVADLSHWQAERLNRISVVGLAHGNLDADSVAELQALFAEHLTLDPFEITKPEVVIIDDALLLEVPVAHDDASMVLYVQDAAASYRARATSALASAILQQAYFSSLRTEQQLGYVVAMNNRTIRDRGAVTFIIQSPVASPAALEQATIRFMEEQLPRVREMDPATFEQFKAGLISRLTERAQNLRERSGRYLADLEADVTTFDSQQQIADIVADLSRQDVTDYLAETLHRLGTARLLIYSLGRFSDAPAVGRHVDGVRAEIRSARQLQSIGRQ